MDTPRIAVVTGASAGVGRATAVALAAHGFDVALIARGQGGLEAAAKEVESAGRRVLVCPLDVADHDAVDAAATRIESELGPIAVWVNDAMTTVFSPFSEIEPADFTRALEVTFLGQVWGTRAALARMRERERGHDRQRRVRTRLHRHPAPVALLRVEVRVPWVLRVGARGVDPRGQQHPPVHGSPPGGEHPAIRLGQDQHGEAGDARPPDLPTRGSGRGDRARGPDGAPIEGPGRLEQDPRGGGQRRAGAGQPVRRDRRVGCTAHRRACTARRSGEPRPPRRSRRRFRRARSVRPPSRGLRGPVVPEVVAPNGEDLRRATANTVREKARERNAWLG